jgi:hypothetical protein
VAHYHDGLDSYKILILTLLFFIQIANNLKEKEFGAFVDRIYAESQQKYETKH